MNFIMIDLYTSLDRLRVRLKMYLIIR